MLLRVGQGATNPAKKLSHTLNVCAIMPLASANPVVALKGRTMTSGKRVLVVRGNDKDFTVRVTKDGKPVDLTPIEIYCEAKDKPNGNLLFVPVVTKTDPAQGVFKVRFLKTQTQNLSLNQRFYFDFLFVFPDGTEKNFPTPPFEAVVVERITD
jgi:hypothetical protein